MSARWEVVFDGPSNPMLQAPTGEVYRINQLGTGRMSVWGSPTDEDLHHWVARAMNAEAKNQRAYFAAHAPIGIRDIMSLLPSMDIHSDSDRAAVCAVLAKFRVEYADAMIAEVGDE